MTKIKSLSEYLEIIKDYEEHLEENNENKNLYFRGESKTCWDLKPSIFREDKLLKAENKLFDDMQRYLYSEFKGFSNTLDKLVYMQHHGLPTRLLDVTSNPLVSLYFACATHHKCNDKCECSEIDCKDKRCDDGLIYILPQYDKVDSEKAFVVSLISKLDIEFERDELTKLITEELNISLKDSVIDDYLNSSEIFIKTNRSNNRQINQDGDFLLFSNQSKENKKELFFIDKNKMEYEPIIIDKNKKESILKELNRIGINIFTLFPEADRLSQYLISKHTKTKKKQDLDERDKLFQVLDFMKSNNMDNELMINFIKNNDIFEEKNKKELILLGYEKIGIFDMDSLEKFINSL